MATAPLAGESPPPWIDFLIDARLLAFVALVTIGVVLLASSPARGTRHARWIAASSILFGFNSLLQASVHHLAVQPPKAYVLFSLLVTAQVIMCLSIGLDAYRRPSNPTARQVWAKLVLVPLLLLGYNAWALAYTSHWQLAVAWSNAALATYPAWKALQIYRVDRWPGHHVLFAALLLVPLTLIVSSALGLSLDQYRRLTLYPATLALLTAFGLLQLRDAMERRRQMVDLQAAKAQLRQLADSLEATVQARTRRLETAIEGLKAFNALVSHDLRAPLRNARGLVDVALEEIQAGNTAAAVSALEVVRKENRRGSEMVDDLLRLSSVEETPLALAPTAMSRVLEDAVVALQTEHPQARSAITIGAMPTLEVDPGLMAHVAINLLGNALKYGRGVADLRIRVSASRLDNGHWRFEVADNGPGFAPEHAPRIFEPFMRVPGTKEGGTGVGLTVVARVVRRHHGEVGASSAAGQGATFWWTLPETQPVA